MSDKFFNVDGAPLISIVTPCLNRASLIEESLDSVLQQDYPNVEHIIVDGGSTDGTLDILKKYTHLRVICEPDENMYDALNKGISLVQGEIIGHLNTDDFYEAGIFFDVARCFAEDDEIDMVYGGATVFEVNDTGERRILRSCLSSVQTELSWQIVAMGNPAFNARFFRKRVYERLGTLDASYRIISDREFLARVFLAGIKQARLNRIVYHYRWHEESLTFNPAHRLRREAVEEHLALTEHHLLYSAAERRDRAALKYWHSRKASDAVSWRLKDKKLKEAVRYMWRGWRFDVRWPLRFLWVFVVLERRARLLERRARLKGWSRARYELKKLVTAPRWVWRKINQRVINRFAVLFLLKKLVTDPRWVWRKINQRVINRFVVLFLLKKLVTDPRWVWRKTLVRLGVRSRDAD